MSETQEVPQPEGLSENPHLSYAPETRVLHKSVAEAGMKRRFDSTERPLARSRWTITQTVVPDESPGPGLHVDKTVPIGEALGLTRPLGPGTTMPDDGSNRAPDRGESKADVDDHAQYELVRMVGMGGCGEVYLARQCSLGRLVAVKRIRPELRERRHAYDDSPLMADLLFRQEAATTALLEHPNIVPVHDLGEDETGSPLLAMKFVRGTPWDKIIEEDFPKLPVSQFLARHLPILLQMAQAVAFAHSRGIVHRDLKPSQVMIGEFGEILLMDWGLAIHVRQTDPPVLEDKAEMSFREEILNILPTVETATNPAGTPALMAPEQTMVESSKLGKWTDMYLLGGTLYFLLTGTFPHLGKNSLEAMKEAARGHIMPPDKRVPDRDVPPELQELAMDCLRKEPENRVASVKTFIARVEDFLSGASRRRESVQVTDKVRGDLGRASVTYHELADMLNLVNKANNLWAENPAVNPVRDQVSERFAREALDKRDLNLARFQGERIRDNGMRNDVFAKLEIAEREQTRQGRQRHLFLGGIMVLMIMMVAVSFLYNFRLRAEREERQRALIASEQARSSVDLRLRELEAFHQMAEAMKNARTLRDLFAQTLEALPAGFQYPDRITVRIIHDGRRSETPGIRDTQWRIEAPLRIDGRDRGLLQVFYTTPPTGNNTFLPEERRLVEAAGTLLEQAIEREELRTEIRSMRYR